MPPTLKKLIQLLSDGEFHSGATLGKTLSLTRSAVWKLIKQFPQWGLEIESITGKGYRIPNGIDLLDITKLHAFLDSTLSEKLSEIQIFDSLPSTNDYLTNLAPHHSNQTLACFAERQTAGKGRRGRKWITPFGKNLTFSLLWHFPGDPSELAGLSLSVAVALIKALNKLGISEKLALKWPNDVLWDKQKLAGILIELLGETHETCRVIIGIGLNIDMPPSYSKDITQPWTDLYCITKKRMNRNQIAGMVLNELLQTLHVFQHHGLKPFQADWQALDITAGKPISLATPTNLIQGIGRGINEYGHYLLENNEAIIKSFASGEVSLVW